MKGNLIAVYGLQDQLRPDAIPTITELRKRGIEISLISGDNNSSVKSIAAQLGISSSNVRSRCTPKQKQEYVKSKLTSGFRKREAIVLFCGDGTNDAPSLAQASIGVHMNGGTEVAASAADAVIMRPSLGGIVTLIDLSKAFHRRVVFNFGWSFVYNLFAVLLAAGAFPHARILPQYAGLGEVVSVVPVIAIAMQLKWKKF
jgi:Cu2+-exporting ATPase